MHSPRLTRRQDAARRPPGTFARRARQGCGSPTGPPRPAPARSSPTARRISRSPKSRRPVEGLIDTARASNSVPAKASLSHMARSVSGPSCTAHFTPRVLRSSFFFFFFFFMKWRFEASNESGPSDARLDLTWNSYATSSLARGAGTRRNRRARPTCPPRNGHCVSRDASPLRSPRIPGIARRLFAFVFLTVVGTVRHVRLFTIAKSGRKMCFSVALSSRSPSQLEMTKWL